MALSWILYALFYTYSCFKNYYVQGHSKAEDNCLHSNHAFEVQTAPISDGALPGVIRQLVIEWATLTGSLGFVFCDILQFTGEGAF